MLTARTERIDHPAGLKFAIEYSAAPVFYSTVIDHWQKDANFRQWFTMILADSPFSAFRWETPPITKATAGRPFEFVVLDSPELIGPPDASAFEEHFCKNAAETVLEFPNLGRDAI